MRRFSGVVLLAGVLLVGCGGGSGDNGTVATSPAASGAVAGSIDAGKCADAATAMAAAAAAIPQAIGGTAGDLTTSVDQLQALTDAAPADIRADLQIVTDGYAKIVQILADANFDPNSGQVPSADVIAQLTAAAQELDKAEFRDATTRVNAWFANGCSG
jgi:hypothetical protein